MAMPVVVPRYPLADLEAFPDDGHRYELLDGVLLVTSGPAPLHEVLVGRLQSALNMYLGSADVARVFPRGTVERTPRTHLEPEILVVPAGGIGPETPWTVVRRWWLAVGVSGRGSRVYDRDHKLPAYLALGVREAWRVDLVDCPVEVARPGAPGIRQIPDQLLWHPPPSGDLLTIDVAARFQG